MDWIVDVVIVLILLGTTASGLRSGFAATLGHCWAWPPGSAPPSGRSRASPTPSILTGALWPRSVRSWRCS